MTGELTRAPSTEPATCAPARDGPPPGSRVHRAELAVRQPANRDSRARKAPGSGDSRFLPSKVIAHRLHVSYILAACLLRTREQRVVAVARRIVAHTSKSPSLSQSVPLMFTAQPIPPSRLANSVLVLELLSRWMTCLPSMSLKGRVSPIFTTIVFFG
jgi:hypothetical protein